MMSKMRKGLLFCCLLSSIGLVFYSPSSLINSNHVQILFDNITKDANDVLPNYKYIWKEYFGEIPPYYNCPEFVKGNAKVSSHYFGKGRVALLKEPKLSMECTDIRRRVMGNAAYQPLEHSYAVARNVYKNYSLQELLLAFSYSPSSFYCYAVDKKSQREFKKSLNQLANCLPNVFILVEEYPFDSAGHLQDKAHYDCSTKLLRSSEKWEYLMFLQNDDVFVKTPEEVSQIISVLNGTSLVSFEKAPKSRIPKSNLTSKELKLFKNESEFTKEQLMTPLKVRKSPNHMFLPREFLATVHEKLNLQNLFRLFHKIKYGGDEMLFGSLVSADFLNFPGQIEAKCNNPPTLRYVHWNFGLAKNCLSFKNRHGICLIGVEYISLLNRKAYIVANKIWPEWDFGAIMCIGEVLYNRTNIQKQHKLILKSYQQLPQVREYELKSQGKFNISSFVC